MANYESCCSHCTADVTKFLNVILLPRNKSFVNASVFLHQSINEMSKRTLLG